MDVGTKKEIRIAVSFILGLIFIAIVGYIAGIREGEKISDPLKKEVDLLQASSKIDKVKYFNLTDSIKKNSERHEVKIDIISEIKKAIRNEISKTKQTIYALPDSSIQYHIDSIRGAGGFR